MLHSFRSALPLLRRPTWCRRDLHFPVHGPPDCRSHGIYPHNATTAIRTVKVITAAKNMIQRESERFMSPPSFNTWNTRRQGT